MKKFFVNDEGKIQCVHGNYHAADVAMLLSDNDIITLVSMSQGDTSKLTDTLRKALSLKAHEAASRREDREESYREKRKARAEAFHKQVMFEIHEVVGDKPFTVKSLQFEAARRNCFTVRSSAMYSNHLRKTLYERDASLRVLKDPVLYSFKDGTTATRFAFNGPAVYMFVE